MAFDKSQPKEIDLDRTDKLPILEGVTIDEDVEDDSVRLDYSATMPATAVVTSQPAAPDYRPTGLDLPSLAESVRSVEERIARQNADYEALNRLYEKARDGQLAAGTRADALASELGVAQSALAVEQHRLREMQAVLAEKNAASEQMRLRTEEALRESERAQSEARTLRDALVARDATIAQVLHSLGERDAQLSALQREHALVVPDLEARSVASAKLEAELREARERAEAHALDLKASRQSVAELMARLARGESELHANRRELSAARVQVESYLEILRTREWRGGFNQNMFREWDDKVTAAQSGQGALQAECERLKAAAATLQQKLAEQNEALEKLNAAKAGDAAALAQKAQEMQQSERARSELLAKIEEMAVDRKRLEAELGAAARELAEVRSQSAAEAQRAREAIAAAEAGRGQLAARIAELEAQATTHEEEMTVLMAHLNEARRPIQDVQAELKRVNEELARKTVSLEQLTEESRALRANLDRTRGALEERDLLIRRLERSASNNANVLGRLQTSIERLGSAPVSPAVGAGDYTAELVRIDGEQEMTFALARRTRIGRAPGCELQIDSQSVSRNHAMILKGPRELIVEDLNSTNGVLLNGRRVTRHLLNDGDMLTIGEIQFRCVIRPRPGAAAVDPAATSSQAAPAGIKNLSDVRPADPVDAEPKA